MKDAPYLGWHDYLQQAVLSCPEIVSNSPHTRFMFWSYFVFWELFKSICLSEINNWRLETKQKKILILRFCKIIILHDMAGLSLLCLHSQLSFELKSRKKLKEIVIENGLWCYTGSHQTWDGLSVMSVIWVVPPRWCRNLGAHYYAAALGARLDISE